MYARSVHINFRYQTLLKLIESINYKAWLITKIVAYV